ncbi:hypothetical protein [Lentzea aerocolonigenes]|uniref:hypothetical protein n=1 Tax=Lentzea aerocolonigenes TaxID=68170 RepID=UPI000AD4333C|nr:hypothetical protein [Lentzea aerocolonigenes]MCP2247733.1 hypothetical protein [Lentzea aerocolonigenes]
MTLIMMIAATWGIMSCSDHRLTLKPGGKRDTDASTKYVIVSCPDGSALISYTGLGRAGYSDVSEWMRDVLRGKIRTVGETLLDLREQASRELGRESQRHDVPHYFTIGAFVHGRPWAATITNEQSASPSAKKTILTEFHLDAFEVCGSDLTIKGSGEYAIRPEDRKRLDALSKKTLRNPSSLMKILAETNKRAAESVHDLAHTISPSSTVVFMPPSGLDISIKRYGATDGEPAPEVSHILSGIDLGLTTKEFLKGSLTDEIATQAVKPKRRR